MIVFVLFLELGCIVISCWQREKNLYGNVHHCLV